MPFVRGRLSGVERGNGFELETQPKELVAISTVFEQEGFPLDFVLREMFQETKEHRFIPETFENNRKGGGFLQATRDIADSLRRPRQTGDVRAVLDRPMLTHLLPTILARATETRPQLEGLRERANQWLQARDEARKQLSQANEERLLEYVHPTGGDVLALDARINEATQRSYDALYELDRVQDDFEDLIREKLEDGRIPEEWWQADQKKVASLRKAIAILPEGERLVGGMLVDFMDMSAVPKEIPRLNLSSKEKKVGTCTTAEVYFLDVVTGSMGYAQPDIVVGEDGDPVLLLKNAGERSAITLKETVLNGVRLPKGSLLEVDEGDVVNQRVRALDSIQGVRFLRLTSLAVSPEERAAAVGSLYAFQKSQGMRGYDTVTIDQLYQCAKQRIPRPQSYPNSPSADAIYDL